LKSRYIIGWREFVAIPRWGIRGVVAKIDTGARTSAIHVDRVRRLPGNRVHFEVVLSRKNPERTVPVETDIVRVTRVRSSSGHRQERYVVAAGIRIGPLKRRIELTLVRRDHMTCRMLLGRTAVQDLLVDPMRKHILGDGLERKVSP
jgi:hypothetical protein